MASSPPSPSQASSSSSSQQKPYACDTLPPPQNMQISRNGQPSPSPATYIEPAPVIPIIDGDLVSSAFDESNVESETDNRDPALVSSKQDQFIARPSHLGSPQARRLCVRHQRMADRGTNLKLQQSLDAMPLQDRANVTSIWSTFSSSSHPQRELILDGLLQLCCFSQLLKVSEQMSQLTRLDPFTVLPREIALRVLGYLDAISLCRAAQVSRQWSAFANDDILWRSICEQHIGQKCHKCGWGLPLLERRRKLQNSPNPGFDTMTCKRDAVAHPEEDVRPSKRQRSVPTGTIPDNRPSASSRLTPPSSRSVSPGDYQRDRSRTATSTPATRPWKDVYCERLTIERNWRRGRCTVRTLKGHTDGVMCVQFIETLDHPSFPVLISGSYDRTARVWNMETGMEVRCLKGHSRAIRALQFDNVKLITGSMDHTMRVWDWRTGRCLRILEGHTEGVVSLNFDSNVLASGSVDTTVKIWNFRTGVCFTLRGHRDWVNSVQLWNSTLYAAPREDSVALDQSSTSSYDANAPTIDAGKMLFSASDDGTIRLWDLTLRTCVRQFTGHVGQVQGIKLLVVDPPCDGEVEIPPSRRSPTPFRNSSSGNSSEPTSSNESVCPIPQSDVSAVQDSSISLVTPQYKNTNLDRTRSPSPQVRSLPSPVLVSGSLDSTIRVWDIETGNSLSTLFGHIEGVWAVAGDKLRLVSGSHDRTIKVWVREEGRCVATLFGHSGAVTCLSLGDDKIVSGSDDHDVRIWDFSQ